jgi:uncharacterized membrane protein YcjF (UPF0283 family)
MGFYFLILFRYGGNFMKQFNANTDIKEKEEVKVNKDIFKQTEQIINVETTSKEEQIIKKESKKLGGIIFTACMVLLTFFTIVCLIDVFTFTRSFFQNQLHGNIAGGIVTGIIVLLIILLVVRPIVIALSTPVFQLDVIEAVYDKEISRRNYKRMQKVAQNIIDTNDNVTKDSKNLLRSFMHNRIELNNTLKKIYKTEISKDINKTINMTASKVLLTTAISQSGKFDALSVTLSNVRMIMQICVKCGYHPTYARLSKLILKVFRNALFAYSIESINAGEFVANGINKLTDNLLGSIPVLGTITKSLVEGSTNALLTLRIGILTRKYLFEEYALQEKTYNDKELQVEVVNSAIKEANENIDEIVKECKGKILIGKKNNLKVK